MNYRIVTTKEDFGPTLEDRALLALQEQVDAVTVQVGINRIFLDTLKTAKIKPE